MTFLWEHFSRFIFLLSFPLEKLIDVPVFYLVDVWVLKYLFSIRNTARTSTKWSGIYDKIKI